MRRTILILMVLLMKNEIMGTREPWILPNRKKRIDQVTFLAAHNAYANYQDGWRYAQQRLNLEQQLHYGVRGLLLDIHTYKGTIVLSHGGCKGFYSWLKSGPYDTLYSALVTIKKFVENNPEEIVTIFFENYVDNNTLKQYIESFFKFHALLLTKNDWNPNRHHQWPTIEWMQRHNKRIIIFNEDKSRSRIIKGNDPFFPVWDHVLESRYGTTNLQKAYKQRPESCKFNHKNRNLSLLNYFGTITIRSKSTKRNSYETLKILVQKARNHGYGKTPNWIALDFIDKGNSITLINELNRTTKPFDSRATV